MLRASGLVWGMRFTDGQLINGIVMTWQCWIPSYLRLIFQVFTDPWSSASHRTTNGTGFALHFFFFYFQRRELWNKAKTHPLDWGTINKYLRGGDYEDILDVIDLLLTIFPTSTDAERGFSALKHIKTDRRNLLKGTTLNKLMGVKLLTEDIGKWDPTGQ